MGVEPLKVLIADDHPLMLAGIRRALERSENIEVAGEARSGPEVIALAERRRPDLVLLDMCMPGVVGTSCIEAITRCRPGTKVVVLSANDEPGQVDAALAAGASGYIIKSVEPVDIATLLRQIAAGSIFRPFAPASTSVEESPTPPLSDRERVVLEAAAQGLTTSAISRDLWVSEHTVKFHLTNIYRKLGVCNRAGAVRYALENGLVRAAAA